MSRPAAMRAAATSSSTVAAAGSASTIGWAPVNGRTSSAHPSGVAQRSQPAPAEVSAMTRSARNNPTAAPPSSSAILRVEASWLAERAHPHEHRHDRGGGERELGRPARRQAGQDQSGELGEPQDQDARRDRGHRRRDTRSLARPNRRAPAPSGPCPPRSAARAPRPAARRPRRRSPASRRRARRCSRRR